MLNGCGNDLFLPGEKMRADRLKNGIIGFGGAGGKKNFIRIRMNGIGNLVPGLFHNFGGLSAHAIE